MRRVDCRVYKKVLSVFVLASLLLVVPPTVSIAPPLHMDNEDDIVSGTGTIVYLDFEGGFYGIVSDGGENYDPLNLDQEFQVDGLRVYFTAKIRRDVVTIRMWGITVEILEIRRVNGTGTVISVEPGRVTKGPEPTVGEEFTIDITLSDVVDLYGWEVQLFWDNALLNCTAEEYPILPSGLNWEAPNSLLLGPGITQGFNETHGRWYHGLSALPMSPPMPEPFTGTIKLVRLTFEVLSQPAGKNVTSVLKLAESKVSDPNAIAIEHEVVPGIYEILSPGLPPIPKPKLEIIPAHATTFTGANVTVDVVLINLLATHMLIAVEFKVGFDGDVLEGYPAIEGPFMEDPMWAPEGTWFDSAVAYWPPLGHYVVTAILIIPQVTDSSAEWTVFPEGNGTLATITFTALGSSALILFDTKLVDVNGEDIPHWTNDGFVEVIEARASPDVNGDGVVDVFDIVAAAIAFGSYPGHPRFNPVADLTLDGIIDIYDLVTIALAFDFT